MKFHWKIQGIQYRPGDALRCRFKNDPVMVDELLGLLELDGSTHVTINDDTLSVRDALIEKRELTQSYPRLPPLMLGLLITLN
ncbi:hypothetical protein P4S73_20920 [Paraglaciecola sp. Hal342]